MKINKEELRELLKDDYEECSYQEATNANETYKDNGLCYFLEDGWIYFKPKQLFPIIFEGDNYRFKIGVGENKIYLISSHIIGNPLAYTEKYIEENKKSLAKLEELRK